MNQIQSYYPTSYEASRQRFVMSLERVRLRWPNAKLESHQLAEHSGLTIDWIHADAHESMDKVLIFTTGEHGIEGYVGSAMLQRFLDTYFDRLDPANTGVLLVHAINPWGMQTKRRTNPNNVDLNRNFVYDPGTLDPSFNPGYAKIDRYFNPPVSIRSFESSNISYFASLARQLIRMSWDDLRGIWLLGQYHQPKGIHFGSRMIEEETKVLMDLYKRCFQNYGQLLQLDMHTGYGPRYQMSLVNSVHEPRRSDELCSKFDYPLVVAANPDEFYAIHGDMIDYIYELRDTDFADKRLYATSFEFGTFGEKMINRIRTLRAMVLENQLYWYGTENERGRKRVRYEFEELFYPSEEKWRRKAIEDADQAFQGILSVEGYISHA